MKSPHHTHILHTLVPHTARPSPSFYELIDVLTSNEVITAAKHCGQDGVRESIYRHLDDEIFRIGVAHLVDAVPKDLYALYEELMVELKDKNPAFQPPILPSARGEEATNE